MWYLYTDQNGFSPKLNAFFFLKFVCHFRMDHIVLERKKINCKALQIPLSSQIVETNRRSCYTAGIIRIQDDKKQFNIAYLELLMFEIPMKNYVEKFDGIMPEIENSLFVFDFGKGHANSCRKYFRCIQNSALILWSMTLIETMVGTEHGDCKSFLFVKFDINTEDFVHVLITSKITFSKMNLFRKPSMVACHHRYYIIVSSNPTTYLFLIRYVICDIICTNCKQPKKLNCFFHAFELWMTMNQMQYWSFI